MTAVQSLRPTARPLASEKKFCMAVNTIAHALVGRVRERDLGVLQ